MKIQAIKPAVLIVDDVPENLLALERVLRKLDVDIITATSGNEALTSTLYHDFSLILLDVLMPDMNGYEIAEMLKRDERTEDIPIVFITAMEKDESQEIKGYSKGAVDYMFKPINEFILTSKVSVLLDLYKMKSCVRDILLKPHIERPKILIVDDNPENLYLMEKLLKKLDALLLMASSGNEALTLTLHHDFALILLDVQMPGMDGYEVAELLKSEDRTANIPIIFVTAIDRDVSKELKGYDKGAVDFIFKPFNEFILVSKVKIFLETYNIRASLEQLVMDRSWALRESNKQLKMEIARKERTEAELKESEARYRTLHENVPVGLTRTTPEGRVVSANPAFFSMFGYGSETQLRDLNVVDFYQEPSVRKSFLRRLSATGRVTDYEAEFKRRDGSTFWVSISAVKVYDAEGNFTFIDAIAQDITKRKRMEFDKAQLESQLRLSQKMEAIGTLAGGIAHDFNNILTAILGYADLSLASVKAGTEIDANIQQIIQAGQRATDLVKQILSFSRQETQTRRPVLFHLIVKEALKLLRASIPVTIEIHQHIDKDCCMVDADPTQLHQVMMNLCTNAYHAMREEGGRLTISLKPVEIESADPMVAGLGIPSGPYLKLEVKDTGRGMDAATLERIFEPYFTTKKQDEGTGLGLAVVHGIVLGHGGRITVHSEPGKGATFTVYLPHLQNKTQGKSSEEELPASTGRERILVVDDEVPLCRLEKKMLESLGYRVTAANDSREALRCFKDRPGDFDLVITDMTMPHMTGVQLARHILELRHDIPLIICTGYSENIDEEKAKNMGFRAYIKKPIVGKDFARLVRAVLDERGQS